MGKEKLMESYGTEVFTEKKKEKLDSFEHLSGMQNSFPHCARERQSCDSYLLLACLHWQSAVPSGMNTPFTVLEKIIWQEGIRWAARVCDEYKPRGCKYDLISTVTQWAQFVLSFIFFERQRDRDK